MKISMTSLDDLWARCVKERDRYACQRCGRSGRGRGMQAAHVFSRVKRSVRWDLDCGVTLDTGCHFWGHTHPLLFNQWAQKHLGPERYTRLLVRSQLTEKAAGVDRVAVKAYLRRRLMELGA